MFPKGLFSIPGIVILQKYTEFHIPNNILFSKYRYKTGVPVLDWIGIDFLVR